MGENIEVINTAVLPSVGVVGSREQEVSGVIDSWQGGVIYCVGGGGDELEEASWVLWFDGAAEGEVGAHEHPKLVGLVDRVSGGRGGDVWLNQQICGQKNER